MDSYDGKSLYNLAGLSAILLFVYSLATLFVVALIGPPPATIEECFNMLNENKLEGLLRLDLLTIFAMPLYFILFLGLYFALRNENPGIGTVSVTIAFVGITLFLSAPSVFSFLNLSERYFNATTDVERNVIRAAAEALLATDIWHGTGPRLGGLLVETGAIALSFMMLGTPSFGKLTAFVGIITHALDLIHVMLGFFNELLAESVMIVAGPLYLVWFPLVMRGFFKLANS
jgi:hypothetical protein